MTLKSSLKRLAQLSSLNKGFALSSISPAGLAESATGQAGNTVKESSVFGLFLFP
jgi:hypothetical protein